MGLKDLKQLRNRDEKLLTKSPDIIQDMHSSDIQNLIHEFNVNKIELEMQNENLKKIKDELEESQLKYFNLYDLAPVGYLTLDEHGFIIESNLTATSILGLEKNKIINRSFSRFISSESQQIFNQHRQHLLKKRTKQTCQLKLNVKSGKEYCVQLESVAIGGNRETPGLIFSSLIDITNQKKMENEIKQSEKKYRTLFELLSEPIFLFNMNGKIMDVNDSATKLFDQSKEELIGKKWGELKKIPEEEIVKHNKVISCLKKGDHIETFETKLFWEKNEYRWIEMNPRCIRIGKEIHAILVLARDITEQKKREREIKNRLMKYELEEGNLYLVKEKHLNIALEAFKDLLNVGYSGVLISRSPKLKQKFQNNIPQSMEFYWLTENEAEETLSPELDEIKFILNKKIFQTAILIDRLDYIITKNNFKKVLEFVQYLHDIAYLKNHIILISIDSNTIKKEELSKLEKETLELIPVKRIKIGNKYLNILKFVFKQNMIGINPTLTDIKIELDISKPTVIKRVRELELAKYLTQKIKGRSKFVELTEKGNEFFLK